MRTDLKNILIDSKTHIKKALEIMNKGAIQIALVVDEQRKLLGTLTDGDIRRGFLNGLTVNDSIETIIFKEPLTANIEDSKETILKIALEKKIHQVPIVDNLGTVIGLEIIRDILDNKNKSNQVVLMAGGLGNRLRPLTEEIPKPLLKVGKKPILETIIARFKKYGYTNIIISLNYKSDLIKSYFGDGSDFGVDINYIVEKKRLGTAGALSMLKDQIDGDFFVMNADILTNINFEYLQNFHLQNQALATMCVRDYKLEIPFGVIETKANNIIAIKEKPHYNYSINAGIYFLSNTVLDFIPQNKFFDMPNLFEILMKKHKKIISFPIKEYWLDIGRIEEYHQANKDYDNIFEGLQKH